MTITQGPKRCATLSNQSGRRSAGSLWTKARAKQRLATSVGLEWRWLVISELPSSVGLDRYGWGSGRRTSLANKCRYRVGQSLDRRRDYGRLQVLVGQTLRRQCSGRVAPVGEVGRPGLFEPFFEWWHVEVDPLRPEDSSASRFPTASGAWSRSSGSCRLMLATPTATRADRRPGFLGIAATSAPGSCLALAAGCGVEDFLALRHPDDGAVATLQCERNVAV